MGQVLLEGRKGEGGWDANSLPSPVMLCSVQSCLWMQTQVSEEWPPAKWRGSWEVEVTATEVSSPGGHTAGKTGRVGSLGSPGMGSPRKAVLSLKDFPVVMCFPSYIQC